MLPFSVVMMAVAPNTPKLVGRFGADRVGMAGMLFVAAGLVGIALFQTDTDYPQLVVTMCVLAGGMALTMTPMTTQLMAAVPRDRAGMGSATNDTTRELGGALGVAVLGSLLAGQYTSGVRSAVAGLPEQAREIAEGSIGGVIGLIEQGLDPGRSRSSTSPASRSSTGCTSPRSSGPCVVVVAALIVKRYLPADRPPAPEALTLDDDADAPGVQALREPDLRQR